MKVYELIIDEDKDKVDYIAIVDRPAIESDFIAFNEDKQRFKIVNEEKRIVRGYFMIADLEIYRNDEVRGEHLVKFSGETIKTIAYDFMKNGRNSNVNLMHDINLKLNDVFVSESFLIDKESEMLAPKGFKQEADNSWFGTMYVENEEVWQSIKDGKFKGFSVEGNFTRKPVDEFESQLQEIKNLIEKVTF
jgi:hypothetical protein